MAEDEKNFSFFLCPVDDEGVGLVLELGAASHMINNREMFIDIDDSFSGKVQKANKTESQICGRGTVEFLVKDSNQLNRKSILENALFITENSHSQVSISKLRETGAEILIGPVLSIIDKNGVEYPFRLEKIVHLGLARKTAYCRVAQKCGTKDWIITILRTLAN